MVRLDPSTLHPPVLSAADDAAAGENLPWVLLEVQAYVAKRDNATTAFSKTWDGKQIQVTFCARRPPRVSYICVHSPDAAEIHLEPQVLAVEDRLLLLRISAGPPDAALNIADYYVYEADDGSGVPSLSHLPRTPKPFCFDASDIGILPYGDGTDDQSGFFLRPHRSGLDDSKGYVVAGLHRAPWGQPPGQFDLCLFDSRFGAWKTHAVKLNKPDLNKNGGKEGFYHKTRKVVTIGGSVGTMAFVDLWRGIIFCDVLQAEGGAAIPPLRYIALPAPLQKNKTLQGDARVYRNIALVGGRLKYVELQLHLKASVVFRDCYFRDGWMAAIWSLPAAGSSSDSWQEHARLMDSKDIKVATGSHSQLLPRVETDEGMVLPLFKRVDVCQPVLSLDSNVDILYFTTKRNRSDADGWVVAVDLGKKEILKVAPFDTQRYIGIDVSYIHCRISKYLRCAPGTQGTLKRQGLMLPQSSMKKQHSGQDEVKCVAEI